MNNIKYYVLILCILTLLPVQTVKSEPVTLGIIGTALGAAALGLGIVNSATKVSKKDLDCKMKQCGCGNANIASMPVQNMMPMPSIIPAQINTPMISLPEVQIPNPAPIVKAPIQVPIQVIQPVQYYYQPVIVPMYAPAMPVYNYGNSYSTTTSYGYRRY